MAQGDEQFGVQNSGARSAADRVVTQHHEAVIEN
jgi:hypothetical protein